MTSQHADDVAAASAAYTFNVLPEICKLPASEAYQRLYEIFLTSLLAYTDCAARTLPDPSSN